MIKNILFFKKYNKIIVFIFIYYLLIKKSDKYDNISKNNNIKIALCTMGKKENLYAQNYMEYYIKLGVDHMFIYDNNDPFTEKIEDVMDKKFKEKITFYDTKNLNISHQSEAFNNCYKNNFKKFDWFIMVDMDEYLYIIKDSLKNYLNNKIFDKCDIIKIHWANSQDKNLLYYDKRPLFERFPKPYVKSIFVKSIIRGNIPDLKYWVHSPKESPTKNVTCTNDGKIINYENLNIEFINEININKAYLIHFRFKSTEEFINKYKRGYSDWHGKKINKVLQQRIATYFIENGITQKKVEYIERELNINLSIYKSKLRMNQSNVIKRSDLIFL